MLTDPTPRNRRVIVIGAGAAGTMAAIFAAAAGAETLLLERTKDGGRKILISGGGRCNILPARLDESRFVTDSPPHLLRKIVRSWPLREQIAFFERDLDLPLVEEVDSAKLFPASQKARDVRDRLLDLARRNGARLLMNTTVTGFGPDESGWRIDIHDADPLHADALVVATGGLSVPNTGSDGAGLRIVDSLGHTVRPTYAALTPLTADPAPFGSLSGVSLPVTVTARTEGVLLNRDRRLSLHAPRLQWSGHPRRLARRGALACRADVACPSDRAMDNARRRGVVGGAAASGLAHGPDGGQRRDADPARRSLIDAAGVDPRLSLANLSRADRLRLVETLVRSVLPWTGDEGYKKAEVTGGGVSLTEIDPRTMESRRHKGLFLCGEMLDAFGPIGGYNFLWAWATGRAAGLGASATIKGLSSPTEGFSS